MAHKTHLPNPPQVADPAPLEGADLDDRLNHLSRHLNRAGLVNRDQLKRLAAESFATLKQAENDATNDVGASNDALLRVLRRRTPGV
jgi:hypothetical protein